MKIREDTIIHDYLPITKSWWPHETADSAGGGPALKPTKSDSCPQSHKKTTVRRQLASPRPTGPSGEIRTSKQLTWRAEFRCARRVSAMRTARTYGRVGRRTREQDRPIDWRGALSDAKARAHEPPPPSRFAPQAGTSLSPLRACAAGWPGAGRRQRDPLHREEHCSSRVPSSSTTSCRTPQLRSTSFAHAVSGP